DSALRIPAPGAGIDIAAANARDLFSDGRQPPPKRYKMPGESDAAPAAPPARPTVLGTVMAGDGGHFATAQVPGGNPVIIRAGEKIGGYTVVAIERGKVTFRGTDGERFTIDASKPVP